MDATIKFLTMFASLSLVFLTVALCVEIAKSNRENNRKAARKKYPTIEDIRRKYPKRKPVELPTDRIYEDFSKELTPVEFETIILEIPEQSFNRLLELVQDREKAINGILLTMKTYPEKSATWACQKEITDIENMVAYRSQPPRYSKKDRDTDRYL